MRVPSSPRLNAPRCGISAITRATLSIILARQSIDLGRRQIGEGDLQIARDVAILDQLHAEAAADKSAKIGCDIQRQQAAMPRRRCQWPRAADPPAIVRRCFFFLSNGKAPAGDVRISQFRGRRGERHSCPAFQSPILPDGLRRARHLLPVAPARPLAQAAYRWVLRFCATAIPRLRQIRKKPDLRR